MKVKLYSTDCPKCNVLKSKLEDKGIKYDLITDINMMREKKITSAPVLEIGDCILDFHGSRILIDSYDKSTSFETFVQSRLSE